MTGVGTGLRKSDHGQGDHRWTSRPVGRDQARSRWNRRHPCRSGRSLFPATRLSAWARRLSSSRIPPPARDMRPELGGAQQPGERDYPAAVRPGGRPGGIYTLWAGAVQVRVAPVARVEDLNGAPRRPAGRSRISETASSLAVGRQRDGPPWSSLRIGSGVPAQSGGRALPASEISEPEQAEVQADFGWCLASLDSG